MTPGLGTVLIGGGSGFIGTAISRLLQKKGYRVMIVSRKPGLDAISWSNLNRSGLPSDCTAVVNVAGQNVMNPTRRWTPGYQQNVVASRVNTTLSLAQAISKSFAKPRSFTCISGVGYYKPSLTEEYTEDSPGGDFDFFSRLCTEWEYAGTLTGDKNVRHTIIRSGVVLGREGGMIKQLYLPFFLGLGGPVGSGEQWMPWIHVEDLAALFVHCIEHENVYGVLNGVAPVPATNKEFSTGLAKAMWRPALIPLPIFALNMAFGKERAKMMAEGQKVIPKRTLETGFQFDYPDIHSACKQCARLIYADGV